jgi:hypothetical protein
MKTIEIPTRPSVAAAWSDLDERFFRIVRHLFAADFLYGASVLLATNDED